MNPYTDLKAAQLFPSYSARGEFMTGTMLRLTSAPRARAEVSNSWFEKNYGGVIK
jgi:hypothetical protein